VAPLFKHSKAGELELAAKDYQDVFIACIVTLEDDYLFSILKCVDSMEDITVGKKLHKFVEEVCENKKDIIMTYGQLLGQEAENRGIEKGKEDGMQVEKFQTAIRMLKKGLEFALIQELTGLTLGELQTLR
jgi:hypothetical protein